MNEEERGNRSAVAGQQTEVVVLAGGCFWGVEEILRRAWRARHRRGVYRGWLPNPTYDDTHDSRSGHTEAVRVHATGDRPGLPRCTVLLPRGPQPIPRLTAPDTAHADLYPEKCGTNGASMITSSRAILLSHTLSARIAFISSISAAIEVL